MDERLAELIEAVETWQKSGISEYWCSVGYIGAAMNRFGDHDLTFADGKLWHLWNGDWREIEKGSDFWLFSVPGAFVLVRDILTKVLPSSGAEDDAVVIKYDEEFGLVRYLKVKVAKRDSHNFTFEVRRFSQGAHPDFQK